MFDWVNQSKLTAEGTGYSFEGREKALWLVAWNRDMCGDWQTKLIDSELWQNENSCITTLKNVIKHVFKVASWAAYASHAKLQQSSMCPYFLSSRIKSFFQGTQSRTCAAFVWHTLPSMSTFQVPMHRFRVRGDSMRFGPCQKIANT